MNSDQQRKETPDERRERMKDDAVNLLKDLRDEAQGLISQITDGGREVARDVAAGGRQVVQDLKESPSVQRGVAAAKRGIADLSIRVLGLFGSESEQRYAEGMQARRDKEAESRQMIKDRLSLLQAKAEGTYDGVARNIAFLRQHAAQPNWQQRMHSLYGSTQGANRGKFVASVLRMTQQSNQPQLVEDMARWYSTITGDVITAKKLMEEASSANAKIA